MKNIIRGGLFIFFIFGIIQDTNSQNLNETTSMTIGVNFNISDSLKAQIGSEVLDFITTTDTIIAYHLEQGVIDTTGVHVDSFKVIKRQLLADSFSIVLKSTITQDSTYHFHGLSKRCEFLPHIAFTFHKADDILFLYLDFDCQTMRIRHAATENEYDVTNGYLRFVELCNQIFTNEFDAYLYSE
jgi:hypothetical protein